MRIQSHSTPGVRWKTKYGTHRRGMSHSHSCICLRRTRSGRMPATDAYGIIFLYIVTKNVIYLVELFVAIGLLKGLLMPIKSLVKLMYLLLSVCKVLMLKKLKSLSIIQA